MAYVDDIKSIPITDYAQRIGFYVTSLTSNRYVSLKEHDSVRIDLNKNCFFRNSTGDKGSVIDFALAFSDTSGCYSPKEAMDSIASMYGIERSKEFIPNFKTPKIQEKSEKNNEQSEKFLILPKQKMFEGKIENSKAVEYLINERKINKGVVDYFLNKGMLYQDIRNNCVFKTDDFACVRSTGGKRFVLDAKGCDYNKGFFFKAKETANQLFVAESVIDIMSVMSVRAMNNRNYEDSMYLALSGVEKTDCIYNHLKKENKVEIVNLCFDNDKAGNRACEEVMAKLADEYPNVKAVACYPPRTKDWNEYLVDISTPKEEKQMSLSDYQEAIAERKKNNPLENRKDNSIQKENKVEDRSR